MADRQKHQDGRSRLVSLMLALAVVAVCVLAVAQGLAQGFELWMITQPLMVIGVAVSFVLRERGRRLGIIVGYGLVSIAMLMLSVRAVVRLATHTPTFPGVAFDIFGFLMCGALLAYFLRYALRSYGATPPSA